MWNFCQNRSSFSTLQLYHALDNFSGNIMGDVEMIYFSNLYIPRLPVKGNYGSIRGYSFRVERRPEILCNVHK